MSPAISLWFEYDEEEHRKLEDAAIYREVAPKDPGVFWHHSFEALVNVDGQYTRFLQSFDEQGVKISEEDVIQPIDVTGELLTDDQREL